jgi:hypothetical protein
MGDRLRREFRVVVGEFVERLRTPFVTTPTIVPVTSLATTALASQ